MKYAISCRRNYIHEIQEYTDIEGIKKWFLGKTSEICSNMESAREKEAVSIIEKAKSYIRDNYKKDISLDEVSREVDISLIISASFLSRRPEEILSSILQKCGFGMQENFSRIQGFPSRRSVRNPDTATPIISAGYSRNTKA